jgi:hypothetical protein
VDAVIKRINVSSEISSALFVLKVFITWGKKPNDEAINATNPTIWKTSTMPLLLSIHI